MPWTPGWRAAQSRSLSQWDMLAGMTGRALRRVRRTAGYSQRTLAQRLGLHPNTVARMERGELRIPVVVGLAVVCVCRHARPQKEE